MKRILSTFISLLMSGYGISQMSSFTLDYETAERLSSLPFECIQKEYPNKLNQVLTDSTFLQSPQNLHPVFYGCFDWHSSVHGHWLLAAMLNKFPDTDLARRIITLFDEQFTAEKVKIELAYFEPELEKSFERTYGWAWILKLAEELHKCPLNDSHGWTKNLKPLTDFIMDSFDKFLPKLLYPVRSGEHPNTAYGLSLAWDFAVEMDEIGFQNTIDGRARDYYLMDEGCNLKWEPSGYDFLSPCLYEAELMSKILSPDDFAKWIKKFMPEILKKNFVLEPAKVADRTDGKLVHLDGLNFSRASCLYRIARLLPKQYARLREIADLHIYASIDYVVGSDYAGGHWLATFLVHALIASEQGEWVVAIKS